MSKTISTEWLTLKYFWNASRKHKRLFYQSLLSPLGAIFMSTLLPFYFGKILAALGTDPAHATHFLPYVAFVGVIGVLANRYGFIGILGLQAVVLSEMQTKTLETLLEQSASFHNNRVAGKLVSDAIEFPTAYGQLNNTFFVNVLPFSAIVISGVSLVMFRSWQLGLVLLGLTVLAIGTSFSQSKKRKPLRSLRLKATKDVTAHLADVIVNNQTVKTFAQETGELNTHHALNTTLLNRRLHDWNLFAKDGNNRIAAVLAFQILYAFLVIHIVEQNPEMLAIGIFAFTYSMTVANNLFNINNMVRTVEDALLQASPMIEVMQDAPEIVDAKGSKNIVVKKGHIVFKDVEFSYKESLQGQAIFENLTLDIKPGTKIGLVGPSGGGKSTLTRLILRFEDIQAGEITIDGQNIASVTQGSLRENISYVPQEPLLFHRTVLENIAYSHPEATKESVIKAAQQANAHEFIVNLPQGYETLVGERGVKLSGGQRQRVAIARAILKNAPILILDEATSALDSESEVLIQQALQKLMRHKTSIVIAHRLSTIQKMDRIVVLENGKIAEEGTHAALLESKGTYARLWAHQSGGFIED